MNYKFNAKYFKNNRTVLFVSLIAVGVGLILRQNGAKEVLILRNI